MIMIKIGEQNAEKERVQPQMGGKQMRGMIIRQKMSCQQAAKQTKESNPSEDDRDCGKRFGALRPHSQAKEQQGEEKIKMLFHRQRPIGPPKRSSIVLKKKQFRGNLR